jgi:hypothetical protein
MPTGYTSRVQNGKITTLRDFALSCARAFGACIDMRDAPHDAPIPEKFEPHDYHEKELKKAEEQLVWLNGLTAEQRNNEAQSEYEKRVQYDKEYMDRVAKEFTCYSKMLTQVVLWKAPDEVSALKQFMLDQLHTSIEFDCSTKHIKTHERKTGDEWYVEMLESIKHDISYHAKGHIEEVKRTEERNHWLATLRASLPEGDA